MRREYLIMISLKIDKDKAEKMYNDMIDEIKRSIIPKYTILPTN